MAECYDEPLSSAQIHYYRERLLAFNSSSLKIKKLLTSQKATLVGLKKTAQLYKLNGEFVPTNDNTSFQVINLKNWNRPTSAQHVKLDCKINASSEVLMQNNYINRNHPQNSVPHNSASPASILNDSPRTMENQSDSNFIAYSTRKVDDPMGIGNVTQTNKTNDKATNNTLHPKQSLSLLKKVSPIRNSRERRLIPAIKRQNNMGVYVLKTIVGSTAISVHKNGEKHVSKVSKPITHNTEVENCSYVMSPSTGEQIDLHSSEKLHQSSQIAKPVLCRKIDETENQILPSIKSQANVIHTSPSNGENRATYIGIANEQLETRPLVIDAVPLSWGNNQGNTALGGKINGLRNIYGNDTTNSGVTNNNSEDSFSVLRISTSNQTQTQMNRVLSINTNSRISMSTNFSNTREQIDSQVGFSSSTSAPTAKLYVEIPRVSESIDLCSPVDSKEFEIQDISKASATKRVNMESCSNERVKGIRNKSEISVSTDTDTDSDIEMSYCPEKLHVDEENPLINHGKPITGHTSRYIDNDDHNSSDKYEMDRARKDLSEKSIIIDNSTEGTGMSGMMMIGDAQRLSSNSLQGGENSISIGKTFNNSSTENCYDKLKTGPMKRRNFMVMVPSFCNKETTIIWEKINGLLSTTGLEFIMELLQMGLIRGNQNCSSPREHNERSMKLIQVQGKNSGKEMLWSCSHCQELVSVFHGSIFEGAHLSPFTIIKLIYYWCIQTNIEWLKIKENLHHSDISKFYSRFRAVCTTGLRQQILTKLGGNMCEVQVSSIDVFLGERVIILGALEPGKNCMILKAISCQSYIRKHIIRLILNELSSMVHSESVIVTDFSFLADHYLKPYFATIQRFKGKDFHPYVVDLPITNFLNTTVRMFIKTKLSGLEIRSMETVQLVLNELVWRKKCDFSPTNTFNTFLEHLSVQTSVDLDTLYIHELDRVAKSPLLNWWKLSENGRLGCIESLKKTIESTLVDQMRLNESRSGEVGNEGGKTILTPCAKRMENDEVDDNQSATSRDESLIIIDDENITDNHSSSKSILASLNEYYYGYSKNRTRIKFSNGIQFMNCPICSLVVTDNINMMKHIFIHAVLKDETCLVAEEIEEFCRYCLFTSKGNMGNHVSCNAKPISPLTCLICLASFEREIDLFSHMRLIHVQTEMPYSCKVCGFRTSEYRYIIDHFYLVHRGDKYVQCPFCLQAYSIISAGKVLDMNVCFHFYKHIKQHLMIGVNHYCYKCCLNFLSSRMYGAHRMKDHLSCKSLVVKYAGLGPNLDDPSSELFIKKQLTENYKSVQKKYVFVNYKHEPPHVHNLPAHVVCVECQESLLLRNHFPGNFRCKLCTYSTCCGRAIHYHIADHHSTNNCKLSPPRTAIILTEPMKCECGFLSFSGSKLADHLVLCGKTTLYKCSPVSINQNELEQIASL
ncbi:uncharacterized protein LOC111048017 [Nilaparvata lugens]|uniref:uncharacterized protein LOC111048017 n=1 Tax=Nilaparvata lugens TaxID=108931 RepID=UPI00193DF9E4|nr:uncharacterized protein LOC111048017 [Nilaparvata lugens]